MNFNKVLKEVLLLLTLLTPNVRSTLWSVWLPHQQYYQLWRPGNQVELLPKLIDSYLDHQFLPYCPGGSDSKESACNMENGAQPCFQYGRPEFHPNCSNINCWISIEGEIMNIFSWFLSDRTEFDVYISVKCVHINHDFY